MKIGAKIFEYREKAGLTQTQLGNKVGISQSTIARIEGEEFKKIDQRLFGLFSVLGIDTSEIEDDRLARIEPAPDKIQTKSLVGERDLPVYAAADGGDGTLVISTEPVDYVDRPDPLALAVAGYGVIMIGDSMEPEFRPGDTLLVHPHLPPISPESCVFYSDDGRGAVRSTIKSFVRMTETHWHVQQFNPKKKFTLPREKWQRCHRVVGKYSRR